MNTQMKTFNSNTCRILFATYLSALCLIALSTQAATITVTSTKTISADTTIDGGSVITISGDNMVGVFSPIGTRFAGNDTRLDGEGESERPR